MKHITTAEIKQMADAEGLILQGCGGAPEEWVSGINETLTQEGILLDGDTFRDIYVFEHDGLTNILFSMENVNLDAGKLAMWRLATHGSFGGTWLSDYLVNRLGVRSEEDLTPEQDQTGAPAAASDNKLLITRDNIKIDNELIVEDDHVNAYIGLWFDVDKRFGTETYGTDDYINLYADYYPTDERLEVYYVIIRADGSQSEMIPVQLDDSEKEVVLHGMREAGLDELVENMPGTNPATPVITVAAFNKDMIDDSIGIMDTDTVAELFFPTSKEDIMARLAGIGVDGVRYKAVELDAGVMTLPDSKEFILPSVDKSSIDELNFLAVLVRDPNAGDLDLFAAALEANLHSGSVAEIINLTNNLNGLDLQPAFNAAQYGAFLLDVAKDNTSAVFRRIEASADPEERELATHILRLEAHVDENEYGSAVAEEEQGVFTGCGYLTITRGFDEFYLGPESIPSGYRVFAYPEPDPPTAVKDVDLAPFLMKMHAVRGCDMSDAEYNLGVLSALHSTDYLLLMNGKVSFLSEAALAYRHASFANDNWRTTEGGPEPLAVAIHVTETHGRLAGDVVLLDFARQREEILGNSILPIRIDAILSDGSEKSFAPEEWGALQQIERDSVQSRTLRFAHDQTDAINDRLAEIRGRHEATCNPVSEATFLTGINAAYMAQSQCPQPDMLRMSHPAAREMLARGDAEVFRLTPDEPEALVQMDAVRSGLWYSVNREFAIRCADMDGLNKWAARVAGDVLRQNERGQQNQSKKKEETL